MKKAFRDIPFMGVIWVVDEAMKLGFSNGDPDWCNLGQGQPEVFEMEGAPARVSHLELEPLDHAYGHINGTDALCEAIAAYYNRRFRQGKKPYTAANVSVASGGRLGLSRIFSALDHGRLGYQIPDYTAYEDQLAANLDRITPVMVEAREEDGFVLTPERFAGAVKREQLDSFLVSNPCNPTGQVIQGEALKSVMETSRREECLLLLDEFYSDFIFTGDQAVSGAEYIDDPETDPVLIIDGLTKNHRYPGWRIGWTLGPKDMISTLGRVGSSLDGGPPRVTQRAALAALEPSRADQETSAVRKRFKAKRDLMADGLQALGIRFAKVSDSTFYLWGSLQELPEPIRDADDFFREALKRKVMTVPGRCFNVNPGHHREHTNPYAQWMRFSFGPSEDNIQLGLERLSEMVKSFQ